MNDSRRLARYYRTARTAHVERLSELEPGDFFYTRTRDDWDEDLAQRCVHPIRQRSLFYFIGRVATGSYSQVEVNEPLLLRNLPGTCLIALSTLVARFGGSRDTRLVFYAIENFDVSQSLGARLHLPSKVTKYLIRMSSWLIFRRLDKVAFGTDGAASNYRRIFGKTIDRLERNGKARVFPALPSGARALSQEPKDPELVCFVGTFEHRKGVMQLLAAWSQMQSVDCGQAQLQILGKGPLKNDVLEAARGMANVRVILDPPRSLIHETFGRAHVGVLLSRAAPGWREQVGLPIVEALQQGCEIVTTSETGLADWLLDHGHEVVAQPDEPRQVAAALARALRKQRTKEELLGHLPAEDGRIQADHWMFGHQETNSA